MLAQSLAQLRVAKRIAWITLRGGQVVECDRVRENRRSESILSPSRVFWPEISTDLDKSKACWRNPLHNFVSRSWQFLSISVLDCVSKWLRSATMQYPTISVQSIAQPPTVVVRLRRIDPNTTMSLTNRFEAELNTKMLLGDGNVALYRVIKYFSEIF